MLKSRLTTKPPRAARGPKYKDDYNQLAQEVAACRDGESREITVTVESVEGTRQKIYQALKRRGVLTSIQISGKKLYISPSIPEEYSN